MRFFWPVYFVSLAAGTAAVYTAAPLARPYLSAFVRTEPPAPAPARPAASLKAAPARDPAAAYQPAPEAPTEKAVPVAAAEELPPALNGIYLAQRGEKPGWGVTHQRTTYYTLEGARVGTVEGGVLLEFRGTRTSSKGAMVECVLFEHGTPSAPLLVGVKDVFLFTGSHTKLSPRQAADLQAYYALNGKIANRKNELLQVAAAKNPFFAEYNAAHKALMAHIERAQELAARRDKATELEKTRIEDQLREMKVAETQLRAAYDAKHLKFRTWKQDHANELGKPEDDAFVKQWSGQMAELRPRIPGLAY